VSYQTKYKVGCHSLLDNAAWIVYIEQDGFLGSVTELLGAGNVIEIRQEGTSNDILSPIIGTSLTIHIQAESRLQLVEFLYASNKEYRIIVKEQKEGSSSVYSFMSFFILPEGCQMQYINGVHIVTLIATDGLGDLKNIEYRNPTTDALYTGWETDLEIVRRCLMRIGDNDINLLCDATDLHEVGYSSGLANYKSNQDRFLNETEDGLVPWFCYDVLKAVLESYGARLIQGNQSWWIVRPVQQDDLVSGYNVRCYSMEESSYDNVAYQIYPKVSISDNLANLRNPAANEWFIRENSLKLQALPGWKSYTQLQNTGVLNLIKTGSFQDDITVIESYWIGQGFMYYDIVPRGTQSQQEYVYDKDKDSLSKKLVQREDYCMKLGLVGYGDGSVSYVEYNETITFSGATRFRIKVESKTTYGEGPDPLLGVMIWIVRPLTGKKYYLYRKSGETDDKRELQWVIEDTDTPCIEVPYDGSDSWQSWEFVTDIVPFSEDNVTLHVRLHRPIEVSSDGANVGTTYYDNIEVYGTAEDEMAPTEFSEDIELNEDNTEVPADREIKIGDCYRTRPSASTSHPTNEFQLKGVKVVRVENLGSQLLDNPNFDNWTNHLPDGWSSNIDADYVKNKHLESWTGDDPTDWEKSGWGTWSIVQSEPGVAKFYSAGGGTSTAALSQYITMTAGQKYGIVINVKSITKGMVYLRFSNRFVLLEYITTPGIHVFWFEAEGSDDLIVRTISDVECEFEIDYVQIFTRHIIESPSGHVRMLAVDGKYIYIYQTRIMTIGNYYKLVVNVSGVSNGYLYISPMRFGGTEADNTLKAGINTFYRTAQEDSVSVVGNTAGTTDVTLDYVYLYECTIESDNDVFTLHWKDLRDSVAKFTLFDHLKNVLKRFRRNTILSLRGSFIGVFDELEPTNISPFLKVIDENEYLNKIFIPNLITFIPRQNMIEGEWVELPPHNAEWDVTLQISDESNLGIVEVETVDVLIGSDIHIDSVYVPDGTIEDPMSIDVKVNNLDTADTYTFYWEIWDSLNNVISSGSQDLYVSFGSSVHVYITNANYPDFPDTYRARVKIGTTGDWVFSNYFDAG